MNLRYNVTDKTKKFTYILMGVGLVSMIAGIFINDDTDHHQRTFANLLVNSFFFFSISLGALFFLAVQYAANAAWAIVFKRIFEAVSSFLPVGSVLLLVVFLLGFFHVHHLYHWMDADAVAHDELLQHKQPYLNMPFFLIRAIVFLGGWVFYQQWARKRSLEEDLNGGLTLYRRNITAAAGFLVFFGFTSSVAAWDWIMSIDAHWFSTLFGWYVFSGMWISALITIILVMIHLKKRGYLEYVNDSHIHDIGKWMFAISLLWTYLWFAQYMLIWYANIPEEVTYYYQRFEQYKGIFWTMMLINFVFPILLLMSRDAKRHTGFLTIVGMIIFISHWVDVFVMVMPGTVGDKWGIGFLEIGMFMLFLGFFISFILAQLAKADLLVKNHPLLEESIHHHI